MQGDPPPKKKKTPPSTSPPPLSAGFGAAYGTAKSGVGIASMGVMRPELVMKSIVPVRKENEGGGGGRRFGGIKKLTTTPPSTHAQVVMAGVLGIYGLIIAVIISTGSELLSEGKEGG